MAKPELPQRMTATDAAFLYAEQPSAPMHIAGISIVDGVVNESELSAFLESKMHLLPRYRQRIYAAPMNVGHPSWHDDPDFHISNHLEAVTLPSPGTTAQLQRVASTLFEGMLDRNKPLWKGYLIQGLEGNRTAMLWLVHHCMVDGVSGAELMRATFDPSPNPEPTEAPPYEPVPRPVSDRERWQAAWEGIGDQVEAWSEFQRNWVDWARNVRLGKSMPDVRAIPSLLQEVARPPKRLPFNRYDFSGKRRLAWTTCSFADARAIRSACGGTVNDVVLATLGSAVRRYALHHGVKIGKMSMRVMVPVSLRQENERGMLGNKVSLLPVDIPLGMEDSLERLKAVSERTNLLKRTKVADLFNLVAQGWQGATPPALQALMGSVVFAQPTQSVMNVAMRSPGMHMVCTNVPGPQIPLYMMGHRLLHHFPLLPVTPGMGLNVGVFSYNQLIHFGFIADSAAARDISRFRDFFSDAFVELRTAAGVPASEPVEIRTKRHDHAKDASAKKKVAAKTVAAASPNGTVKKKAAKATKPRAKAKPKAKSKAKTKAKAKAKAKSPNPES